MAKRVATSQLTHDNWDQEEEVEEAGTFKTASADVLKGRVIRVAKRRSTSNISSPASTKNVFAGFTGFGNIKPMATVSDVANTAKNAFSFLNSNSDKKAEPPKTNKDYLSKLRSLNEEVIAWLMKNVTSSPCCILTPVFRDYEEYLKQIQEEFGVDAKGNSIGESSNAKESKSDVSETISKDQEKTELKSVFGKNNGPPFSFGNTSTATKEVTFSFGNPSSQSTGVNFSSSTAPGKEEIEKKSSTLPAFSFSSDKPLFGGTGNNLKSIFPSSFSSGSSSTPAFSFGNLNKPASDATTDDKQAANGRDEEADDGEPPKNEFTPVKEEDAVFSQRVKVFVKNDNNYKDYGVGNLFLKETPGGKYQALVRADTSLGNILFNVILSKDTPTKRLGKNNVMLIVIPTPDASPPPVPVLLRVKTSEDADALLEKIEEYKK